MPIIIIDKNEKDTSQTRIGREYTNQGIGDFEFLDAVSEEDVASNTAYYSNFLSSKVEVSNKQFARFMSHRLAWQHIVDQNLPYGLICGDDGRLVSNAMQKAMPSLDALNRFGLIFINNHMTCWNKSDVKTMRDIYYHIISGNTPLDFKGEFGEDYLLTNQAARVLLDQSKQDQVICSVDYYLFLAAVDSSETVVGEVEDNQDLKNFIDVTGGRQPIVAGSIAPETLLEQP